MLWIGKKLLNFVQIMNVKNAPHTLLRTVEHSTRKRICIILAVSIW